MGRFFTSTQIYNPKQLDCDGFKADFCKKMKKEGYEVCEADCAELSYVLAFADNCKWVTISSEAYEQGNRTAQADTARIAKMLGTYCVNTIVIDSDCAMLDLYDDKGKKTDTAVMGRADDYLGDDIPAPAKAVWEKFLSADSTWEQFISVVQGDYVFVEDGLSELAPVIGMDGGNILFEYEDADESNENFCYLSFRKASSKKEKKLTINAAFKKIYGNALIPLGFKWVKTKEPCFIRVINEEIIHVVGIHDMKPNFIVPFGGATTMYRADLMLNKTYRDTANWLPSVKQFWGWTHTDTDEAPDSRIGSKFYYLINSPDSIEDVVSAALRETIRWIMPALDSVQSLQDFLGYYEMCHNTILPFRTLPLKSTDSGNFEADAVIRYLLGNLSLQFEEYSTEIEKRQALSDAFNPNINTPDNIQYLRNRAKARNEAIHLSVISFENDPEVKQQAIAELQRRKKANLEILKSYGIDFEKPQPKKEKKLTINAAFKQVFGELLEPMGFKLVKSKHPYFVRVFNGEILHVITYKTEQAQYPEDKAFNILCGVATIYRQQIDLNAGIRANYNWLRNSIADFYAIPLGNEYDNYFRQTISRFNYFSTIESSLINVMKEASILTEKYVLPVINEINTLENCITFFQKFKLPFSTNDYRKNINFNDCNPEDEGFLYIQADYIAKKNKLEEILSSPDINEIKRNRTKEIYSFFIESEIRNIALGELQRRKKANLEILKSYGIDFEKPQPKKEKKLTLNSAFVKVFGEALVPLGFKKVKSKYPYFAKIVNDEILQVVTIVSRPDKRFEILGGIATVYRQSLSLNLNPQMNESWLIGNFHYYQQLDITNEERKFSSNEIYEFYGADLLEKEMKRAFTATKKIILDIFDKVNSLEKCVEFYNFFGMDIRIHHKDDFGNSYPINYYNEGLLIIKTMNLEQYSSLMDKYKEITINRRKKQITNGGIPYERLMNEQEVFKNQKINEYKDLLDDKDWLATVDIELNNRRNHNIRLLEEYGLI